MASDARKSRRVVEGLDGTPRLAGLVGHEKRERRGGSAGEAVGGCEVLAGLAGGMALDADVEVVIEGVARGAGGWSSAEFGRGFEGGCRRTRETLEGRGSTTGETLGTAGETAADDLILVRPAGQAVAGGGTITSTARRMAR